MILFPIGTSRLHEPLSLLGNDVVSNPGFGYFHSSSQILDVARILANGAGVNGDMAKFFFRKDQTPNNPFNTEFWSGAGRCFESASRLFHSSDVLLLEISSARSYLLNGLNVQGNPNYYRNASYKDVWKDGYYKFYNPELEVAVYDDFDSIKDNLREIYELFPGKKIIVIGHLVDPDNINAARKVINDALERATDELNSVGIKYVDQSFLVRRHGFRILDDGSRDIHHLPWSAFDEQLENVHREISGFRSLSELNQ